MRGATRLREVVLTDERRPGVSMDIEAGRVTHPAEWFTVDVQIPSWCHLPVSFPHVSVCPTDVVVAALE